MIGGWRRRSWWPLIAVLAACTAPTPSPTPSPASASPSAVGSSAASRSARTLLAKPRAAGQWPGPNGLSGVNGDPVLDAAHVEAFCAARGRPCHVAHTYTDRSSYAAMTGGTSWTFTNFATFQGALAISQGLVPTAGEADMAGCAAGEFDARWRDFGTLMTDEGRADSIVRLGWEFNESTMPWRGLDPATYIACFRHAATAIRATAPKVLIDWTINAHKTPKDLCGGVSTNCYPGDDYVDIVGIDNYDHYPSSATEAAFDRTATRTEGLTWLFAFARSHHKLFSVGEWGVSRLRTGAHDNPAFISWMHSWFAAHATYLAYEAYFTNCDTGGVQSSLFDTSSDCQGNPRSAAIYRAAYRQ
jgi:Glycosyl hydrolase family 26